MADIDNRMTALYLRVSTQEQAQEGYSITEQEERLKMYAASRGWKIYNVYTDPGYSGAKTDRPALQQMVRDIEKGRIGRVVVYKLDRLSRSQKDTLYLIEDVFTANNVDFISMTENFDTSTPFGKAIIGILSVFAQLEREQIKERMQMGLDARAREGYYHGGPYAPIGYDYVNGELVINEYEAMQVRRIYDLAETGIPLLQVQKAMEGYSHKHNTHWTPSAVRSVLTTPVYAGRTVWKGEVYEGRHEAIIAPERFDRMVKYIETRDTGPYPKKPFTRHYLLTGLLRCGNCGALYYVKTNTVKRHKGTPADAKPNNYYTCYSRGKSAKNMIIDPTCRNRTYNVKDLDKAVIDELQRLHADSGYFNSVAERSECSVTDDRAILVKRTDDIDKQMQRLIELYQIGGIDFERINKKIADLNAEKDALDAELSRMGNAAKPLTKGKAKRQLAAFSRLVNTAETAELRQVMDTLIDAIIVYDDRLEFVWKF